jgi:hypothetical protein
MEGSSYESGREPNEMDVGLAAELTSQGFENKAVRAAALPVPVWKLELEVERERPLRDSQRAMLKLMSSRGATVETLAASLGISAHERLMVNHLVALLRSGWVERGEDGFVTTQSGHKAMISGNGLQVDRPIFEVLLDPITRRYHWMDSERPARQGAHVWTVELADPGARPSAGAEALIGKLVAAGLPDAARPTRSQQQPRTVLLSLRVLERRTHWRPFEVQVWEHATEERIRLLAMRGGCESPGLTGMLASMKLDERQRRIVAA